MQAPIQTNKSRSTNKRRSLILSVCLYILQSKYNRGCHLHARSPEEPGGLMSKKIRGAEAPTSVDPFPNRYATSTRRLFSELENFNIDGFLFPFFFGFSIQLSPFFMPILLSSLHPSAFVWWTWETREQFLIRVSLKSSPLHYGVCLLSSNVYPGLILGGCEKWIRRSHHGFFVAEKMEIEWGRYDNKIMTGGLFSGFGIDDFCFTDFIVTVEKISSSRCRNTCQSILSSYSFYFSIIF